jgi:hypothetical protein
MLFFTGGIGAFLLAGLTYSGNPVSDKVGLNVFIPLVIGVALVIVGVEASGAATRRARAANATFIRDGATWQAAMSKWNELYYCSRCGSVFNPTAGDRFVPAAHMKELLV